MLLQGPEAFFSAQDFVYKKLEEKHYPSFLVSDLYHQYLTSVVEEQGGEAIGAERKSKTIVNVLERRKRKNLFLQNAKIHCSSQVWY